MIPEAQNTNYPPLNVDRIEESRRDAMIGRRVVVFKSTGSTNDIAWAYAANSVYDGLCVLAESQSKGRGRRGRTWHSRPNESILCSVLLMDPALEPERLTLAAGVAVAEAIRDFCGLSCRIKWPNDLLFAGRKLAGILVEKRLVNNQCRYVVGIGINCQQEPQSFADCRLNLPATSIRMETGHLVVRTELVCKLLKSLELWLDQPADKVTEQWLQLSRMLARPISLECDGKTYRGTCRGVDPANGLIVQLDSGPIRFFHASQTSLCENPQ
jgi:BirA family biotin operon repressor/biotin-[acetyl-CoA-carboxylase] ligase